MSDTETINGLPVPEADEGLSVSTRAEREEANEWNWQRLSREQAEQERDMDAEYEAAKQPSSPRERFFLAIKTGDTPETNGASKIALEWTDKAIAIRDNIRKTTPTMKGKSTQ